MKKTSTLALTIFIVALAWIFVVVAYTLGFALPWLCLGSLFGVAIALAVAELYLLVLRKDPAEQGSESGGIGVVATLVFFWGTLAINTLLLLRNRGDFNWLLLTINFVALAVYVIALLWAEQSSKRLEEQLEKTAKKQTASINISAKLGELLAITEDAEIRGRLLKLKEAVDYSTNISTAATARADMQMEAVLTEMVQLTVSLADRMIILNKLEIAEMTWKLRSSNSSSTI